MPQGPVTSVPEVDGTEALASTATVAADTPGKPRNDIIRNVPVNPSDASIPLNLIPYHDFPQHLRDLQGSDRVSVEIIGQSVQGRDLHLVVITDMDDADWTEWQRLSDLRTDDPEAAVAAFEAGEYDDWRAPIFINNNIHGNEWEGTDAFFQFADELAFSDDEDVEAALEDFLFVGVVSNNPDGRVNATRANAAGFDMNRDWVAQTQPEVLAVRDQILRYDPISLLDLHGYVQTTLIEPTTGPHGQNYEMDLYIRHALRATEAMEDRILALDEPTAINVAENRILIPFRDGYFNSPADWDGWPAVYTPMWAMQHGAIAQTVEIPLNPRGNMTETERHRRTAVNTAVGLATMEGNLDYMRANRDDVVADQLEFFRRGAAGEATRPIDDEYALASARCGSFVNVLGETVEHCNSDTYPQEFPRAWVIPFGEDQRSDTAAIRTAQYLLDNGIEVHRATADIEIDGVTYAAGSFVVDMHQAKRGAANNVLEVGRNLSDDWEAMYGDAAWSVGALYGATTVEVEDGDLPGSGLTEIASAATPGSVPDDAAWFGFEVDSLYGVQVVNGLLAADVDVVRLPDGSFAVPGSAAEEVTAAAVAFGVSFEAYSDLRVRDAEPMEHVTVGVSANHEITNALVRMGFEVVPVNNTLLNNGTVSFDDLNALYIASGGNAFRPDTFNETVSADFATWLDEGNAIAAQTASGHQWVQRGGFVDGLTLSGISGGDGIVSVVNDPESKVTGDALDVSFVRGTRFFPNADEVEGVTVHQRFAEGADYFLAGHQTNFRNAAGQPAVVSVAAGADDATSVVLFGTDPMARAHTEGLFPQVAEALWPALPDFEPLAPTADTGGPYEVELGEELVLDGSASISPDDLPLTYSWDVSELGGTTLEGETVTVTPTVAGEFEVALTVTDTNEPALSDTATTTVTVTEPAVEEPGPACDDVDGVTFTDVAGGPHGTNIGCVAGYGIALGKGDGSYDPAGTVRRDQMASFLHRLLRVSGTELPANAPDAFRDDDGGVHEEAINDLAALGIVQGRGGNSYDPSGAVTRDQMASFLVRTLEAILERDLTAPSSPFVDTRGSVHAGNIDVAASLGIALGRTPTTYAPRADVRRDQMASFLARTLDVLVDEDVELTPLS
ncbi:PKD domain-containing protein [Nitriliruptoraceae bacterium ZYF776]|nr:PKD domain-containing protein [Profundirhabdus halotolerans]